MKQVAFTRFMLVVAFFVLWIGGISVRLVNLQVTQHSWLKEKALDLRQDVKSTRMLRGSIFDRNGRALAMSLRVRTLYADPLEIDDVESTAKVVAKELSLNASQLTMQLRQAKEANKRYLPIAKKLGEEVVLRVNKALDNPDVKKADLPNFSGLHWQDEQKRSYPQDTLAAQVVGFSNDADDGAAGIELSQDDILHGSIVKKYQERDRLGRVYDETTTKREPPSDVVLTIDSAYQYMVEQALERGVRAANAKSGMAVVMSPKTGEIFALANYPTFDPNSVGEKAKEHISNAAVQYVYSPGSVFKLITYGSALEKNLFKPTDMISSGNGTIEIAKHVFTDSHAVGTVSYSQALAHSSNVCAIKTAMSVGRHDFAAMVRKMGFGKKTGVELPAETSGIVRPVERWYGDSLASMAIGYEVGVTALQMTSAFATIANNGVSVQPHIIKEIRRSDDQPKIFTQPSQTQVVSAETAQNLRTMLKQVVLTGTGRRAQLNGYSAAGKTGTAWKFNAKTKSVDRTKYISSFVGMAPADNPELVIGVVIDEPKEGARDGGRVAAPVFSEIAQQLLHELKVPTDAPVKQETVAVDDIPETAAGATIEKKSAEVKSKPEQSPSPKEKPKAEKKPDAKKASAGEKLTALIKRDYFLRATLWIESKEIET